jgi:hypothetical protein
MTRSRDVLDTVLLDTVLPDSRLPDISQGKIITGY